MQLSEYVVPVGPVELSEYLLQPLREDQEFILYRAGPRKGGVPSVLLLVPASRQPAIETLEKIKHEYSLKGELDTTWAVRPRDLSQYNENTVLVLEDPGGEALHRLIQGPMDIKRFLRFAIGLTTAISQLHARELIHKDLKPSNVLVDAATGHVWLTGFGIASRLPRERQSPKPPEFIAGTLPYMAPEQTGRMNRSIDSRSDLYALGVMLYEMLTGVLPFTASDPMEWVHCHLAKQAVPPSERLKNVPGALSAIIMKLLAKTAEERYQSAAGVESDLRRCLTQWEAQGQIADFPLGEHDVSDRLWIPEKLYGRAREIDILLASFDHIVTDGTPELVLVSGYSGIGKSSVVSEIHKVLVPPRGLFASGKFDQYKRDIPYSTLAQAFQALIRMLLGKNEAELGEWRDAIRDAVGPNGRLMVDLVPELKLIIGEQPPVPDLPSQDAQRRFQFVLRRFIGVFARPEHPLVLFLDDLQWLDAATLDLLEDLLTRPDVRHLMLIGAYRNNEVSSAHPLVRKLEAIRKAGPIVHEIVLAPLAREDSGRLIADSVHCEPERASQLAQLIYDKTAGNPFFAIQFISGLVEEGLLVFDHSEGRWSWDLNRVHAKGYTDNVVDLMVGKLNRLPVETQKALQQLACLGNSADFGTLRMVYRDSNEEVHGQLWEAVRTGLIFRSEDSYKFLHDRVQEAAYSLIPEELRAETHLRIGRLFAAHTPPQEREERTFEIVNQLNRGAVLITSREEREYLAELNLIAAKRAKASTAYASALNYLIAGSAMLDDSWERQHELAFLLEFHRAECEFLTGQLVAAEERLTMLSSRAANTVELATVTCLAVDLYSALDHNDRAVAACLDYLEHLGFECSPHPTEEQVEQEYKRIWSQLGSRKIEELIELPMMTDPASLGTLDVLTKALPPALFTDANLLSLTICRAVNLSLEQGNSDGSCVAYVWLGQIAGPHFGNYRDGFRFGQLGYELVEKHGLKRFQARTYMVFGSHVVPWTKHVRAGRDLIHRAFEVANKIGDLCFAVYSRNNLNTNLLAAGDPLVGVQREAENGREFAQKAGFGFMIDAIAAQLGLIRTLRGLTTKFGSFDDGQFDELRFERHLASDPVPAQPVCFYWIRKLQAGFFAADYVSALDAALKAEPLLWTAPSNLELAEYHLYGALCRAALWDSASPDQRRQHFKALTAHEKQLQIWAENCPENFGNRAALVGAEIARIEGRPLDAERLYEQAIRSAHASGLVPNEALANELAAHFYAARGFEKIAYAYLRDARYGYLRWGATGKVRQLDELYPYLQEERLPTSTTSTIGTPVRQLDVETVIKASQALSSEIVLGELIERLMRIAVEHAGAERGLLILLRGTEPHIEAEATTGHGGIQVTIRQTAATASDLPQSALHYVIRTRECLVLDDSSLGNLCSEDEYVQQRRPRSFLCLPIVKQTKLIGALYLENKLTPGAFTSDRIAVLELLASQGAISLENASLYSELQRSEAFLAQGQSISHTGTFGWSVLSGEIHWSEETYKIFEYDRAVKPTLELIVQRIHPDDRNRVQQTIRRTTQARANLDFEHRLLMPDGSIKYVHVLARALEPSSGALEYVGTVMEVTERKRADQEREKLRQLEVDLAHINRVSMMGELTASLAHEIKQPIFAASADAETCVRWLARDRPDLVEAQEAALRLMKDVSRASDIINRIVSLFKKEAPQRGLVDLNGVVQEMITLLRSEASRYSISIDAELAEGLPNVMADGVALQQVLMNLTLNAIESMKEVGGPGKLTITTRQGENHQLLVSVTDTGVGLPPGQAEQIFTAFFSSKPQGTGMGLPISRSIIESHGGRLWATSNSGPGATFQFALPLEAAARQSA